MIMFQRKTHFEDKHTTVGSEHLTLKHSLKPSQSTITTP